MENYDNDEIIKETRKLIVKGEYELSAVINDIEIWFNEDSPEEVSDEMIEFALDIANAYQSNKEKYDREALKEVKKCLNEDEEVDDLTILNQLGTPIIDIATENGASLMYNSVAEIGEHMPEVNINRNLEVEDVVLNG